MRKLNELGYGAPDSGLVLDLMYNPGGAFLPPSQEGLQADYKKRLSDDFGVHFNQLLTLTNMPVKRFADHLRRLGRMDDYMNLLVDSFNPVAAQGVMCRDTVSISWDGRVFDCDFNQMLEFQNPDGKKNIFEIERLSELLDQPIALADHCYGCTAGAGSSCGGALEANC